MTQGSIVKSPEGRYFEVVEVTETHVILWRMDPRFREQHRVSKFRSDVEMWVVIQP